MICSSCGRSLANNSVACLICGEAIEEEKI